MYHLEDLGVDECVISKWMLRNGMVGGGMASCFHKVYVWGQHCSQHQQRVMLCTEKTGLFLGAFVKLRKTTICFFMSISPSASMKQLRFH